MRQSPAFLETNLILVFGRGCPLASPKQPDLVCGFTPNAVEFARLAKAVGLEASDHGE